MDFEAKIVTGGGKKANRRSHSITIKEVTTLEQVFEELTAEFKGFFPPQAKLTDTKPKK